MRIHWAVIVLFFCVVAQFGANLLNARTIRSLQEQLRAVDRDALARAVDARKYSEWVIAQKEKDWGEELQKCYARRRK